MEMMQRLRLEHRPSLVNIDCDGCEHDIFRFLNLKYLAPSERCS